MREIRAFPSPSPYQLAVLRDEHVVQVDLWRKRHAVDVHGAVDLLVLQDDAREMCEGLVPMPSSPIVRKPYADSAASFFGRPALGASRFRASMLSMDTMRREPLCQQVRSPD